MPGVWILWSKKKFVIIFQKENGNTFTLLIIFIVKSLQKEQNSTNLLLWPPICRNKPAIIPKWFNSLDANSIWGGRRILNFSYESLAACLRGLLIYVLCLGFHFNLHNLQSLWSQIADLSLLQSFAQEIWHLCWFRMSVVSYKPCLG